MARVHQQAAVIPYRIRKERVEVALVTTSRGKGWIVPKGSVDDGERPRDAAIREAEEEAGPARRGRAEAARPLSPRQGQRPLPRGCLPDARHRRTRALARRQIPAAPLDAHPRRRGLSAGRAAAVRPRTSKAWSNWTPERGDRRRQQRPSAATESVYVVRATCRRRRSRAACRRSCRRVTIRSPGTGSPCWTRSTDASGERERV